MMRAVTAALALTCASAWAEEPGEARCDGGRLVAAGAKVSLSFEQPSSCRPYADALRRRAGGETLSGDRAARAAMIDWIERSLQDGDSLTVDRFGRAHVMRCSADPALQTPSIQPSPVIGDGAYPIYVLMELPQAMCPAPAAPAG